LNDEMIRMMKLGQQGFYCSQVLLSLGLEAQGKANADLIRAMAGLAGGLGFSGDICGVLTGGACLLGLYAGKGTPAEEEDPRLNVMVTQLVEWFYAEHAQAYGGCSCEAILGDDPQSRTTRCPTLVLTTYKKVKALLTENGFELSEGRP
jgi:Putative redox-active protein (C_GCAxxG_C_C)